MFKGGTHSWVVHGLIFRPFFQVSNVRRCPERQGRLYLFPLVAAVTNGIVASVCHCQFAYFWSVMYLAVTFSVVRRCKIFIPRICEPNCSATVDCCVDVVVLLLRL